MGLDMYLSARLYTSKYTNEDINAKLHAVGVKFPSAFEQGAHNIGTLHLEGEAMYWRKANQIHNWFVQNVQGGVDECDPYRVSVEQLTELRDLCRELLEDRSDNTAAEKLPPSSGFFFGGTEIDEYYWGDLEETEKGLTRILDYPEIDDFDFTYRASW